MPLLTLFSAPKSFTDPHIATIQRNAIRSWSLLPEVDVLLLGEESGLAEAAQELGVKHIPQVACNANGVPLVSSMVELARQNSQSDLLCIVNADMLLLSDFVLAGEFCKSHFGPNQPFVLLSQRWDLDVAAPLDFEGDWQARLCERVEREGRLHKPAGSDYFIFPSVCYHDLPAFTIGRSGWDNWMIYKARREGWPVIDCTPSVMVVHQNHDYAHLPGGRPHYEHPDTHENIRLAGGQANIRYTILDATHQLVGSRFIRPKMTSLRFQRKLELFLRAVFFFLPEKMIENFARPKRWQKRIAKLFKSKI